MKTVNSVKRVREIVTGIRDGIIISRPDFQRRLVWASKHKCAFIRTVLEGYPFPEVYFAAGDVDLDSGHGKLLIVDGQQRLSTLTEYFYGSSALVLDKETPPYVELENERKLAFLEYEVVVRDLGAIPMEKIKQVFLRINSTSYSLNAIETANARFDGELKKFAERVSGIGLFEDMRVFTANDVKRMNDTKFSLSIVISMLMNGYFNRDDEFESYLLEYNEELPEKFKLWDRIAAVSRFLQRATIARTNRIWKKADLLTAFVEIDSALERGARIRPEVFGSEMDAFNTLDPRNADWDVLGPSFAKSINASLDELESYFRAALQASNDRISRVRRGEVFRKVLISLEDR
jgi:hypothetical protein